MRLAIVRKRFNPFGGAERFIATAANALAARGVEVTVVTETWDGPAAGGLEREIVPRGGLFRHTAARRFRAEVARVVQGGRYDLVQTHERLVEADLFRVGDGVHAAWIDRLARERGAARGFLLQADPTHRDTMAVERAMARETEMLFVANSDLVARELDRWLAVPASRIRVIENGVDLARFRPPGPEERAAARNGFALPADVPVVAFVGSGFERKGAFALIEALALPGARSIHAIVAGHDHKRAALARAVARAGLADRVILTGGLADVGDVLAAADLFALPSLYDPMPNAALEAIACGLPVLTTADTGIADAVAAAGAGAVVTRAPDDISAGLARILASRPSMAAAASRLRTRFDLARATDRWRALYDELT